MRVPWHYLYTYWSWMSFCASMALGTPLTPLSSFVAMLFVYIASTGLWRVGPATAHVSLRVLICVWETTMVAGYLLRFPQLRRAAWWRSGENYARDVVLGAAYLVWIYANGTDPWTLYTVVVPSAVDGKTALNMAVRWPMIVAPLLAAAAVGLGRSMK